MSLGGDGPAGIEVRDSQDSAASTHARLYLAGPVIVADTPEAARRMVDDDVRMGVDIIKIRVDDNLGTTKKMTPAVYRGVIDEAHRQGKRVAGHIY
jgi:hypothetical protein